MPPPGRVRASASCDYSAERADSGVSADSSADAMAGGDGGRVTVLSTQSTTMAGAATARGGRSGGNGGTIELSGETGFRLTGSADTSAAKGALGTVVLDPRDLTITSTANGTTNLTPAGTDPNIAANAGRNAKLTGQPFSAERQQSADRVTLYEHRQLFDDALRWADSTLGPQRMVTAA